jgi:hypothetical protein
MKRVSETTPWKLSRNRFAAFTAREDVDDDAEGVVQEHRPLAKRASAV